MTERRGSFAAGAVAGGAVATLISQTRRAQAAPAPAGVDQAVWDLILRNMEANAQLQGEIEQLINSISSLMVIMGGSPLTIDGEDPFANYASFTTGQLICPAVGVGYQLPPIPIPKNKQLVVKALPSNVGWLFLAVQQAQAQSAVVAYPMLPNEAIGLSIKNANSVWVAAQIINDGAALIVEQG